MLLSSAHWRFVSIPLGIVDYHELDPGLLAVEFLVVSDLLDR